MTEITESNRTIARTIANVFGGQPSVVSYGDEQENSSVDLLTCIDRPQKGVSSYSTIGLSDSPNLRNGKDIGVRVEFLGSCASSVEAFPNILTTAAFCMINSSWPCYPGAIFPDVIAMYDCSRTMRHLLFVSPFLWEDRLKTLEFEGKTVAWLLAVPISEGEFQLAESEGSDKLEDMFEENQIDIFDINRPSVFGDS